MAKETMPDRIPRDETDPSTLRGPAVYPGNSQFFMNDPAAPTLDKPPPTASALLLGAYDPEKLHPLAKIGGKLDYLVLEDDQLTDLPGALTAFPSRGWRDDMCYGTGTMYLTGLALGGLWGVREGARRPLAVSNFRIRINSILNSVTRRGTFIGNSAGVLALTYNAINSSIDSARGKHDIAGSMLAGSVTGALFKSTAGVRPAITAAAFVSGLAGIWSYVKKRI